MQLDQLTKCWLLSDGADVDSMVVIINVVIEKIFSHTTLIPRNADSRTIPDVVVNATAAWLAFRVPQFWWHEAKYQGNINVTILRRACGWARVVHFI